MVSCGNQQEKGNSDEQERICYRDCGKVRSDEEGRGGGIERLHRSCDGRAEVRERAACTGRNSHTGKAIEIAAAKVPAFKRGKALKDAIR